ncbi:Alpha/beta hydrolase family protein [compost metagenome]
MWVFYPEKERESDTGLIFYPGGKVEATAYTPLLKQLSQNGITCVLVKMPFNLAVFDIDAAEHVYEKFPNIQKWYIGGHSLGGAMASSYANKNSDKIEGLILLGAYPVGDSDSGLDLPTLAIYGSEDMVLDKEKLAGTPNKHEIPGGNHAYYGNYGKQKGDGTATITREEQQHQAVEEIIHFIFGK